MFENFPKQAVFNKNSIKKILLETNYRNLYEKTPNKLK